MKAVADETQTNYATTVATHKEFVPGFSASYCMNAESSALALAQNEVEDPWGITWEFMVISQNTNSDELVENVTDTEIADLIKSTFDVIKQDQVKILELKDSQSSVVPVTEVESETKAGGGSTMVTVSATALAAATIFLY